MRQPCDFKLKKQTKIRQHVVLDPYAHIFFSLNKFHAQIKLIVLLLFFSNCVFSSHLIVNWIALNSIPIRSDQQNLKPTKYSDQFGIKIFGMRSCVRMNYNYNNLTLTLCTSINILNLAGIWYSVAKVKHENDLVSCLWWLVSVIVATILIKKTPNLQLNNTRMLWIGVVFWFKNISKVLLNLIFVQSIFESLHIGCTLLLLTSEQIYKKSLLQIVPPIWRISSPATQTWHVEPGGQKEILRHLPIPLNQFTTNHFQFYLFSSTTQIIGDQPGIDSCSNHCQQEHIKIDWPRGQANQVI